MQEDVFVFLNGLRASVRKKLGGCFGFLRTTEEPSEEEEGGEGGNHDATIRPCQKSDPLKDFLLFLRRTL